METSILKPLPSDFFDHDVETVAKALIGAFLFTVEGDKMRTGGMIIETEAYDETDPAAHCHEQADIGRRTRSGSMRLKGGHAYIYSSRISIPKNPDQQMWCLNFTCGEEGFGSAVLIRALHPTDGLERMRQRRLEGIEKAKLIGNDLKGSNYRNHLCSGPAILCEALGVSYALDGHSVWKPPFELRDRNFKPEILCEPRVGVTKATEVRRRYDTPSLTARSPKNPLSEIEE